MDITITGTIPLVAVGITQLQLPLVNPPQRVADPIHIGIRILVPVKQVRVVVPALHQRQVVEQIIIGIHIVAPANLNTLLVIHRLVVVDLLAIGILTIVLAGLTRLRRLVIALLHKAVVVITTIGISIHVPANITLLPVFLLLPVAEPINTGTIICVIVKIIRRE